MSQGLVERQYLQDIGDAIRSKNGSTDTYTPAEMAQAISGIHTADEVVLVQKTVNANGQYNPSDDSADGYSGVLVNVPNSYSASDEGKVVSSGALAEQTSKNVTANGTYNTTENNEVIVNVPTGEGGDPLFWRIESFYGSPEGDIVSSKSGRINGEVGEYVLLIVMHRDTITVDGWERLVDYLITTNTDIPQGISIFIKQITSNYVDFDIRQNSTARMNACSYVFSKRVSITYIEDLVMEDITKYKYIVSKKNYIQLCVMSNAYSAQASGTIEPITATNSKYAITTNQTMRFMSFINTNNKDVIVSFEITKGSSDGDYNRMYIFKIQ